MNAVSVLTCGFSKPRENLTSSRGRPFATRAWLLTSLAWLLAPSRLRYPASLRSVPFWTCAICMHGTSSSTASVVNRLPRPTFHTFNCFWNEASHAWILIPTWALCCLPSSLPTNLAFPFTMLHGLPTNPTNPFDDFAYSEVVSPIAQTQTHPPILIQVHQDQPAPAADVKLVTASVQSSLKHRLKTPRTSDMLVNKFLVAASNLSASTPSKSTPVRGLAPLPTSVPRPGT